jgi:hypothetical protein
MRLALLFAICVTATWPAYGQDTSNDLLKVCGTALRLINGDNSADFSESVRCLGYVQGYRDGTATAEVAPKAVCIPDEVSHGQVVRVLVRHLENNPQSLHKARTIGMLAALSKAFPCAK